MALQNAAVMISFMCRFNSFIYIKVSQCCAFTNFLNCLVYSDTLHSFSLFSWTFYPALCWIMEMWSICKVLDFLMQTLIFFCIYLLLVEDIYQCLLFTQHNSPIRSCPSIHPTPQNFIHLLFFPTIIQSPYGTGVFSCNIWSDVNIGHRAFKWVCGRAELDYFQLENIFTCVCWALYLYWKHRVQKWKTTKSNSKDL